MSDKQQKPHCSPSDTTLVYDRIPINIVFMSFLSLSIAECIGTLIGKILLFPLVFIGILSVLWWQYSGDLRLYGFVQFFPIVFTPILYLVSKSANSKERLKVILSIVAWYLIAKIFEHFDKEIFQITHTLSGHSLKHLFTAVATVYLVQFNKKS